MLKTKIVRSIFVSIIIIIALLVTISCASAPPPAPPAAPVTPVEKPAAMEPGAIVAIPSVIAPKGSLTWIGAYFKPGEELDVYIEVFPGTQHLLGQFRVEGEPLKADDKGSFEFSGKAPRVEGVFPVRVYNNKNELRAVSVLHVQKPEKK